MGKYINQIDGVHLGPSFQEKRAAILKAGGVVIPTPTIWEEGLVSLVDNGPFAAAGYAYSPEELQAFLYPSSRPQIWIKWDRAKEFAG